MKFFRYKDDALNKTFNETYNHGANDFMRRRGGSLQAAFMHGYLNHPMPRYIERGSFAFAAYMAGRQRSQDEKMGRISPAEVKDKRLFELDSKPNPQR